MKSSRVPASLQALFVQNCQADDNDYARFISSSRLVANDKEKKPPALPVELVSAMDSMTIGCRQSWREQCSLQEYFDVLLQERGYHNVPTYDTLSTGYHCQPTELQLASYGPKLLEIVRKNSVAEFKEALTVAGLSPNPCNSYGESLVHMACRRGHGQLLRVMVQGGAALQICDDYGRTPLHDACWAAQPAFEIVELLVIHCDRCLWFLRDTRGALPLFYVPKDLVLQWKDWLDLHMDQMFPPQSPNLLLEDTLMLQLDNLLLESSPPPQSNRSRNCSIRTAAGGESSGIAIRLGSENTLFTSKVEPLSLELIQMVAKGVLSPREARVMAEIAGRGDDEITVADTVSTDGDYDTNDDDNEFLDDDSIYDDNNSNADDDDQTVH